MHIAKKKKRKEKKRPCQSDQQLVAAGTATTMATHS
jgi:hypothetical protein